MSDVETLNARVILELTEILVYCHTCEFQVLELLKVANCIFNQEEFFEVLEAYTRFKQNMEILENLMNQVDVPITILQMMTVKTMVNQLKENFDTLIGMLDEADKRIDKDDIDFDAASLLNEMLDLVTFDVVAFEDFETALSSRYFVIYLMGDDEMKDETRYGALNVLGVQSFKMRRDAYTYALKNGISKEMVLSRYE